MKSRKLFDGITNIREDFIEKAENYNFQQNKLITAKKWLKWGIFAACMCLLLGVAGDTLLSNHGTSIPSTNGGGGSDANGVSGGKTGITYSSYQGPVFPISALSNTAGITVSRNVDYDFSPYETIMKTHVYEDNAYTYEDYAMESIITDSYVLTNNTSTDISCKLLYASTGRLEDEVKYLPAIYVNGTEIDTQLYPGKYSGGFYSSQGESNSDAIDSYNLQNITSWTGYESLLSEDSYLNAAFCAYPELKQKVTVYKITDLVYDNTEKVTNPTINFEYKMDESKTKIITYLFNGSTSDNATGSFSNCCFMNQGGWGSDEARYFIVIGEDISDLHIKTYQNGACLAGDEIEGITYQLDKYETTLENILVEIFTNTLIFEYYGYEEMIKILDILPLEVQIGCMADLFYDYGLLSVEPMARYNNCDLYSMLVDVHSMQRIMYQTFEMTIPANDSISVDINMLKKASFDYFGEFDGRNGYNMLTELGSDFNFTNQSASISNTEYIEIINQNFGFDLSKNITQVTLDLNVPYYYLDIKKLDE